MALIVVSPSLFTVSEYEKAMIYEFDKWKGNRNIQNGGDGGLDKRFPHCLEFYGYVVVKEGVLPPPHRLIRDSEHDAGEKRAKRRRS